MKIYTKTGDDRTTSAITKRVLKNDILMDCLGTIDELQSNLMLVVNQIPIETEITILIIKTLENIIIDLFDLGRDLLQYQNRDLITEDKVFEFEKLIDNLDSKLPELTDFILPGYTVASSQLHVARSVSRRLERVVVEAGKKKKFQKVVYLYLNRLSDLLYVMARSIDKETKDDR